MQSYEVYLEVYKISESIAYKRLRGLCRVVLTETFYAHRQGFPFFRLFKSGMRSKKMPRRNIGTFFTR